MAENVLAQAPATAAYFRILEGGRLENRCPRTHNLFWEDRGLARALYSALANWCPSKTRFLEGWSLSNFACGGLRLLPSLAQHQLS